MQIPFNKISDMFEVDDSNMFCIQYTDSYNENDYQDVITNILISTKNVSMYINDTITKITDKIVNPIITRKIYIPLEEYQRHQALLDAIQSRLYYKSPESNIKLCIKTYTSYDECYIIDDICIESIAFGSVHN